MANETPKCIDNNAEETTPKMLPCPIVGEVCIHPETVDCSTCERISKKTETSPFVQTPDTVNFKEPSECHDNSHIHSVSLGTSYGDFKQLKKTAFNINNWQSKRMEVKDSSSAIIENSKISDLIVRGFCFLKNCEIEYLRVGMFGNLFVCEGNKIYKMEVDGTVHSLSRFSKVDHIYLHCGGRMLLTTRDYFGGIPKQPDNILLDHAQNADWRYKVVIIGEDQQKSNIMEYWAFG